MHSRYIKVFNKPPQKSPSKSPQEFLDKQERFPGISAGRSTSLSSRLPPPIVFGKSGMTSNASMFGSFAGPRSSSEASKFGPFARPQSFSEQSHNLLSSFPPPILIRESATLRKQPSEIENRCANVLIEKAEMNVIQQPIRKELEAAGHSAFTNPDYLIDGKTWDCYAPTSKKPLTIIAEISRKVFFQTERIVLCLDSSSVEFQEISSIFDQIKQKGGGGYYLPSEVIVIKGDEIVARWPR